MIYATSKTPCNHLHLKTIGKIISDYGYEHNLNEAPRLCTTKSKARKYIAALALEYGVTKKQARKDLADRGVTV